MGAKHRDRAQLLQQVSLQHSSRAIVQNKTPSFEGGGGENAMELSTRTFELARHGTKKQKNSSLDSLILFTRKKSLHPQQGFFFSQICFLESLTDHLLIKRSPILSSPPVLCTGTHTAPELIRRK
jgi:hypothetical protein